MTNQPVAWHYPGGKPDQCTTNKAYAEMEPAWTPMYYKHEWVGLTDEEVDEIYTEWNHVRGGGFIQLFHMYEAKLKEKNA